jgi:hypothetical protein
MNSDVELQRNSRRIVLDLINCVGHIYLYSLKKVLYSGCVPINRNPLHMALFHNTELIGSSTISHFHI